MKKEKLSIRVNLIDRFYPLIVDPNDEERIRKAAKTINDRLKRYQTKYSQKDVQDHLSMISLQLASENLAFQKQNDITPALRQLEDIEDSLDAFLLQHNEE